MPKLSILKTFFRNEPDPYTYLQSFSMETVSSYNIFKMWYQWTNHTKSLTFFARSAGSVPSSCKNAACFFHTGLTKGIHSALPQSHSVFHCDSNSFLVLDTMQDEDTGISPETLWDGFWSLSLWSLFLASCPSLVCWGFFHHYSKLQKTCSCCPENTPYKESP